MIQQLRNMPPFIDFGLGVTEKTISVGQKVTIWLSTLYNPDAYSTSLDAAGAEVTRISDYEYEVVCGTPGVYSISLAVGSTSRKISLQSNTLTLTVI